MLLSVFDCFAPQRLEPVYFDIRLSDDAIWLPATPNGAGYGHLRGRVVLCISQPTSVKGIKLHLEGQSYINWDPNFHSSSHRHHKVLWKEVPFHHQIWNLLLAPGRCSPVSLQPDNYEFPFEICLSGQNPETVQGVDDCFIRYILRAEVYSNTGDSLTSISREIQVRKMHAMSLLREPSSIMYDWPEKIIYNVDIPNRALSVGSSTRINFHFIPLLKGLKLGTIETRLIETHHVTKPSPATRSREVLIDEYKPPPWDELDIVPSDDEHAYYLYHFSRILRLPKSTRHCLQSTTTTKLQVEHKIAVLITLLNPDGHMSSIRFSLPIFIYFRPPSGMCFSTLYDQDTSDADCGQLPAYDSHIYDMKPDEFGLVGAPSPGYIQWDDNMEQNEDPPQYSITDSVSDIPSYLATINSYC